MWSRINTSKERDKSLVLDEIEAVLDTSGYLIAESNRTKPWGAYFKIEHSELEDFLDEFFSNVELPEWAENLELDPKILLVAPKKRISWQYHERRGEIWKVISGPVGVYVSDTDKCPQNPKKEFKGNNIQIPVEGRHRLAGLDNWGIVAEIWVHTDPENPSDEDDIVRLQDDFGRAD